MILTLLMARNRETGKVEVLSESRQMNELRKGFDSIDPKAYSEAAIYRNVRPVKRRTFAQAEAPKAPKGSKPQAPKPKATPPTPPAPPAPVLPPAPVAPPVQPGPVRKAPDKAPEAPDLKLEGDKAPEAKPEAKAPDAANDKAPEAKAEGEAGK